MQDCVESCTTAQQGTCLDALIEVVLDPSKSDPVVYFCDEPVPEDKLKQSHLLVSIQASHIGLASLPLSPESLGRWLQWSIHRQYLSEDVALALEVWRWEGRSVVTRLPFVAPFTCAEFTGQRAFPLTYFAQMQAAYAVEDIDTATLLVARLRQDVRAALRQAADDPHQHLRSLPWPVQPAIAESITDSLNTALQTLRPGALAAVLLDCTFTEVLEMSLPVRAAAIASRCTIWPEILDLRESLAPARPYWQMDAAAHFLNVLLQKHDRKACKGRAELVRNPVCPTLLSRLECMTSTPLQHLLAGVCRLMLHSTDLNHDIMHVLPSILPSLKSLCHLVIDAPEVYRQLQLPELAVDDELGAPQYPWYHLALEYPGMAALRANVSAGFKGVIETKAIVSMLDALPKYGQQLKCLVLRGVALHMSGIDEWSRALGRLDQLRTLEIDVISTGVLQP